MATVMKASEFIEKLHDVVNNYKTLYVMGCFGAPLNSKNKTRYCTNHEYNKQAKRTQFIQAATADTFGFDCVNLIKGILWGWTGDKTKLYGGAKYATNGVPDVGADVMITKCLNISTDFSNLVPGEALWTNGHIGVYIGDGLAIECTPAWKNKVQITAVKNMGAKSGYNNRTWKKHGKLPYIEYDVTDTYKKVETKTEGVCTVDVKVLKKGSKGDAVKSLQILLVGYGHSCGSSGVDGDFGAGTYKAVRAYQKAVGLKVDGEVGSVTWAKLLGVK
jgi:hypothetical protein